MYLAARTWTTRGRQRFIAHILYRNRSEHPAARFLTRDLHLTFGRRRSFEFPQSSVKRTSAMSMIRSLIRARSTTCTRGQLRAQTTVRRTPKTPRRTHDLLRIQFQIPNRATHPITIRFHLPARNRFSQFLGSPCRSVLLPLEQRHSSTTHYVFLLEEVWPTKCNWCYIRAGYCSSSNGSSGSACSDQTGQAGNLLLGRTLCSRQEPKKRLGRFLYKRF
ncbi:hypothetical protein Mapa_014970 [Marchantia paleacea]|nr:hypothetical protein Mapa_014970 [Marchantia paleacea]